MKYLKQSWQRRTLIVMCISVLVSVCMIALENTQWADHINQVGYSHGAEEQGPAEGGKRNMPSYMMYILPFVKEIVLIGVPLLITIGWLKLAGLVKTLMKRIRPS
ncbi:hypothetical protein [Echinimonas agarilytica]|uniref:Uncharacterized protein n=1 Tax=Echinimonas agarilytica TaxID=1215918 RepID=A0AA41W881_9GAMM|nr:hypothetical protein [Echinimonas agarilytica]MCM2680312.1 hypothetical protein [Echinimonas agarilytica]